MNNCRINQPVVRALRRLCCFGVIALSTACSTTMSGRKSAPEADGLIYYLPAPHLYMSPQADGTVRVEVKYLPDPTNAYTLKLNSYLSKATFEVGTKDGLLTTVSLDADSSGIAASAVAAATEIRKTRLTAAQAKESAHKTQEEAKRTAVKAAAEAVAAQREKLALLEDKRAFYKANPPKEGAGVDLPALELEISQETLKLKQLENRLGLVKDTSSDAFNDPGRAAAMSTAGTAYGPMLFRMLPDGPGVKLVAVGQQLTLAAPALASEPGNQKPITEKIVIAKGDAVRDAVIQFAQAVASVDAKSAKVMNPSLGAGAAPVAAGNALAVSLSSDSKQLTVKLPNSLTAGQYRLEVDVIGAEGQRRLVAIPLRWLLDQ